MSVQFPESNGWPITTGDRAPYNRMYNFPAWTQLLAAKLSAAIGSGPNVPGGITDTGWVNCTINAGFSAQTGPPQVRRIGSQVLMRGTLSVTGFAANATNACLVVPVGFRPTGDWVYMACVGNSDNPTVHKTVLKPDGSFDIRTGPTLPSSSFQLFLPRWTID